LARPGGNYRPGANGAFASLGAGTGLRGQGRASKAHGRVSGGRDGSPKRTDGSPGPGRVSGGQRQVFGAREGSPRARDGLPGAGDGRSLAAYLAPYREQGPDPEGWMRVNGLCPGHV